MTETMKLCGTTKKMTQQRLKKVYCVLVMVKIDFVQFNLVDNQFQQTSEVL